MEESEEKPEIIVKEVTGRPSEIEMDIMFAGARELTGEEAEQVKQAFTKAEKFVFPPEIIEKLKADGITPEELIAKIMASAKGDGSCEIRKLSG